MLKWKIEENENLEPVGHKTILSFHFCQILGNYL